MQVCNNLPTQPRGAGVPVKKERLALVVTSPMFEGEQFICAPGLGRITGRAQADGALKGMRDIELLDQTAMASYDTTMSNSSPAVGTVALFEEEKGEQILKVPCQHHIYDLFGKNLIKVVTGRASTGPGHPLFIRFAREWPNLVDTIDYGNLQKLDVVPWNGTFVEQLVEDLRVWCRHAYITEVFQRGSYYDLLHSIMEYLGVDQPGFRYRFKKPKDVSNARFMEPAEYYVVLALLSRQITWFTPEQQMEVENMAFISAVLYGPGFLKSRLGGNATFNDLTSMLHFRQLHRFMPVIATEALKTWNRHLDFITPQHITTALTCELFTDVQREGLARALLDLLPVRVLNLPPTRVSYPGPNFATSDVFWPADLSLPELRQFVTVDSFLIPNILHITDEELTEWLEAPVVQWDDVPASPFYKSAFHQMKLFAKKTQYTNDAAERCIKNIKDAIGGFHIEDNLQFTLSLQYEERKKAKVSRNGQLTRAALKNIGT